MLIQHDSAQPAPLMQQLVDPNHVPPLMQHLVDPNHEVSGQQLEVPGEAILCTWLPPASNPVIYI